MESVYLTRSDRGVFVQLYLTSENESIMSYDIARTASSSGLRSDNIIRPENARLHGESSSADVIAAN